MLQNHGFKGNVFVPEYEIVDDAVDYGDEHIDWEHKCLKEADLILFWVPRNLKNMHGLTTNIEWGRWESSGKVLLGYPDHAERMGYMKYYAKKHQVPIFHDLAEMLEHASDMVTQKKG